MEKLLGRFRAPSSLFRGYVTPHRTDTVPAQLTHSGRGGTQRKLCDFGRGSLTASTEVIPEATSLPSEVTRGR